MDRDTTREYTASEECDLKSNSPSSSDYGAVDQKVNASGKLKVGDDLEIPESELAR